MNLYSCQLNCLFLNHQSLVTKVEHFRRGFGVGERCALVISLSSGFTPGLLWWEFHNLVEFSWKMVLKQVNKSFGGYRMMISWEYVGSVLWKVLCSFFCCNQANHWNLCWKRFTKETWKCHCWDAAERSRWNHETRASRKARIGFKNMKQNGCARVIVKSFWLEFP